MSTKKDGGYGYGMFFLITAILLIIIMGLITLFFKYDEYSYILTIGDYLGYVGSFGGATLGAIASFAVISISMEEQKKEFKKQREIDKEAIEEQKNQYDQQRIIDKEEMEEQKRQFEKQYGIELLKYKIDKYEQIYIYVDEIQNMLNRIILIVANPNNSIIQCWTETENIRKTYNKLIFVGIFLDESIFKDKYDELKCYIKGMDDRINAAVDSEKVGSRSEINSFISYCDNLISKLGEFCNLIEDECKNFIKKDL